MAVLNLILIIMAKISTNYEMPYTAVLRRVPRESNKCVEKQNSIKFFLFHITYIYYNFSISLHRSHGIATDRHDQNRNRRTLLLLHSTRFAKLIFIQRMNATTRNIMVVLF